MSFVQLRVSYFALFVVLLLGLCLFVGLFVGLMIVFIFMMDW